MASPTFRLTGKFLDEMHASEVQTYRDDHRPVGEDCDACDGNHPADLSRELAVQALESAHSQGDWRKGSFWLDFGSPKALPALVWMIWTDLDKWAGWGTEGTPFVRVGKRLLEEIQEKYPDETKQGLKAVTGEGSLP